MLLPNELFNRAMLLPDNSILTIAFSFSKNNVGQITLSNSVKWLPKKQQETMKKVLNQISFFVDCFETLEQLPK
jgi:hypothetical protein